MITKYVSNIESFIRELLDSQTPDEIDTLRKTLSAIGRESFLKWQSIWLKDARKLIRASPAERKTILAKFPQPGRLILTAWRFLKGGTLILDAIDEAGLFSGLTDHQVMDSLGVSYVNFRTGNPIPDWPDTWGRSPF